MRATGKTTPGHNNFAIILKRYRVRFICTTNASCHNTITAESSVQATVGVVAHYRYIRAIITAASHNNLAVVLKGNIVTVIKSADGGNGYAVCIKGGIKTAIRVKTYHNDIGAIAIPGCASHDDLSIGLNNHSIGNVAIIVKIDSDFSISIKRRIDSAIEVVAHNREISGSSGRIPNHHNLAICLYCHPTSFISTIDIRNNNAIDTKSWPTHWRIGRRDGCCKGWCRSICWCVGAGRRIGEDGRGGEKVEGIHIVGGQSPGAAIKVERGGIVAGCHISQRGRYTHEHILIRSRNPIDHKVIRRG